MSSSEEHQQDELLNIAVQGTNAKHAILQIQFIVLDVLTLVQMMSLVIIL
jgi:hypothetical protein